MKISLNVNAQVFPPDQSHRLIDLARAADQVGIDDISLGEHVVMSGDLRGFPMGEYPGSPGEPWVEPLTTLASFAGVTERIGLSTSILIAALRHPVLLAKTAATLDQLSRGRLSLGVSTSWHRPEYDALGVPFDERGRILTDAIAACRALWQPSPASFRSPSFEFDDLYVEPKPYEGRRIPIWFGGKYTPRLQRRLVELGDGWMPFGLPWEMLDQTRAGLASLAPVLREAGRDVGEIGVLGLVMPMKADGTPANPFGGEAGDIAASLAPIGAMAEAGVTAIGVGLHHFVDDPNDATAFVERLAMEFQRATA